MFSTDNREELTIVCACGTELIYKGTSVIVIAQQFLDAHRGCVVKESEAEVEH